MSELSNVKTVSVPSIGKLPISDKGSVFTPSGAKRSYKAGRSPEDGGFTKSNEPAKLELTLNLVKGLDVAAINAIEDEDITVRLADGQVHMMSQAFVESPLPVADGEGKITFISNLSERIA